MSDILLLMIALMVVKAIAFTAVRAFLSEFLVVGFFHNMHSIHIFM